MNKNVCTSLLIAACLLLPMGVVNSLRAEAAPQRPNILLIVTDDQRSGLAVMPDTRRLIKREGVKFSRAYSTTPNCCPSRSSILTGRYAHNHGVKTNVDTAALDHSTTIQRYLSDAGYTTAIFGKFLNGWTIETPPPYFSRFAVLKTGTAQPRYFDSTWNIDGTLTKADRYSTNYLRSLVNSFLRDQDTGSTDDRPWFAYVAPNAPHHPWTPSKKYRRAPVPRWTGNPAVFEEDKSDKPPFVASATSTFDQGARIRKLQFRTLMSVDDLVGGVMGRLRELDELEDTIVIFMSDNGHMWSEHGLSGKMTPYPGSTKIPLLMTAPDDVVPGSTDARLVGNLDVAPTLLDAAGLEAEHEIDGRSLLDSSWDRDRLLLENWNRDWASTVTSTYQYTEYYSDTGEVEFREYYDSATDPWQLTNLFADGDPANDPPDASALETRLTLDRSCSGSDCP